MLSYDAIGRLQYSKLELARPFLTTSDIKPFHTITHEIDYYTLELSAIPFPDA